MTEPEPTCPNCQQPTHDHEVGEFDSVARCHYDDCAVFTFDRFMREHQPPR